MSSCLRCRACISGSGKGIAETIYLELDPVTIDKACIDLIYVSDTW
jgi:uncharacterized Fe-S center protein